MSDTAINLFDATMPETREGLSITPAAEAKVRELLEAEEKPGLGLRVAVTAGGCSGSVALRSRWSGCTTISCLLPCLISNPNAL